MSRRYVVLTSVSVGLYDDKFKWQPVTLIRCQFCGTIIGEDGFLSFSDVLDVWPKDSFRARHAATCFGEAR